MCTEIGRAPAGARLATPQPSSRRKEGHPVHGGNPKTIELILPVATPAELRRTVKLSRTARQRVERAIAEAGLRRKSG